MNLEIHMKKILIISLLFIFILSVFGVASVFGKSGGPDNFGYTFIDSNDDPLLQSYYPWIEIKGIGTPVTYSYCTYGNCDDCYKIDVPLGFNFNYYGTNYNKANIMSNGWINFSFSTNNYWFQQNTFPHGDNYIDPISVYGKDIYPCCKESFVYYATVMREGRRVFVVEYYQVPNCCNCSLLPHTFQVQLYEGINNIVFVYKTTSGDKAYIGIEGKDQTDGLTYLVIGDPGDGTVVLFRYPGSPQYSPQKQIPITQILKILKENQEG
jgi:hypothetical protein